MSVDVRLTVIYTGEPDEVFDFREDGQSRTFGRDDGQCDIVIRAALNDRELSRVAEQTWRMSDELWVRNLSTRHELALLTCAQAAAAGPGDVG